MRLADSPWTGPNDDEAREAFVLARRCSEFPSAAARAADWACEGLSHSCPAWAQARSGARIAHLEAAAAALAITVEGPGPWMAAARAQGRADVLVGPHAAAEAFAGYKETCRSFLARAGTIRETFRFALFDLLNWEQEDALRALSALTRWLDDEMRAMDKMGFMGGAHAMLGLREAFDEAHSLQGSGADDLAKAVAIKDALQHGWSADALSNAQSEYDVNSSPLDPFQGEFRP